MGIFGGIPKYLVLDNFPAAVTGADSLNPRLSRGFLEYAQRRNFIADPARPGHPKDKPKVERGVPYARERFFKGGQFNGLADLRQQARQWCLEVAGQRIHGTTRRLPLVVFQEEEQAKLLPYDGEPYDVPDWHKAIVHRDHHIYYRYAIYSAPDATCPPGAELGESVGAFADKLLGGPTPWYKMRQAYKLLRLGEKYTPLRLNSACEKALAVDLIDVRRVERILIDALEQEAIPVRMTLMPPPGRFARPGNVFAIGDNTGGNHNGDYIGNHPGDQHEGGAI